MVVAPSQQQSSSDTLWLPTLGKAIPRPWFLPSEAELAEQRRILESTYFLVKIRGNGGIGEALVCDPRKGGCGRKHDYLTLRCVEQPFSGITGGLLAYYRAVGDNGLSSALAPSERLRLDAVRRSLGEVGGLLGSLPDLSAHHPETARGMNIGARDAQLAAVALGVLEPIPGSLARRYRDRINARGVRPRFTLPGMEG